MIVLVSSVLWLLTAFLYLRYKSIIAPAVLNSFIWSFVLTLYASSNHGLYDLSDDLLLLICLWTLAFSVGNAFVSLDATKNAVSSDSVNNSLRTAYYLVTLLGTPGLLFIAYKQGTTLGEGDFFFNLRMANTGIVESEHSYGIFAYVATFAFVSFLIELFVYDRKSKFRLVLLIIVNIAFGIMTMAKTSFFFIIIPSLIILFFKGKLRVKSVFYSVILLFFTFFILTALRSKETSFADTLNVYFLGGLPALDVLIHAPLYHGLEGVHVFKLFYSLQNSLGLESYNLKGIDFGYSYIPTATNVYTVMYPFFYDFGYVGVIFFSFIYGVFSGTIYVKALKGATWGKLLYSFWAGTLLLQFFGEYIFTNLSYTIQLFILFYFATKRNHKTIWKKSTF